VRPASTAAFAGRAGSTRLRIAVEDTVIGALRHQRGNRHAEPPSRHRRACRCSAVPARALPKAKVQRPTTTWRRPNRPTITSLCKGAAGSGWTRWHQNPKLIQPRRRRIFLQLVVPLASAPIQAGKGGASGAKYSARGCGSNVTTNLKVLRAGNSTGHVDDRQMPQMGTPSKFAIAAVAP